MNKFFLFPLGLLTLAFSTWLGESLLNASNHESPSGSSATLFTNDPAGIGDPTVITGDDYVCVGSAGETKTYTATKDPQYTWGTGYPAALEWEIEKDGNTIATGITGQSYDLAIDAVGEYRLICWGISGSNSNGYVEKTVYVVEVDLEIYSGGSDLDNGENTGSEGLVVDDADEESVGSYILVNWDNDDNSMTEDPDDPEPISDLDETDVTDEDNLAKVVPSFEPDLDTGTIELEVVSGSSLIKFWDSSTKGTEIQLTSNKKTWDLSVETDRTEFDGYETDGLWIEGVDASSSERDVEIVLRYKDSDGNEICKDTVKATIVMIRLGSAVYRNLKTSLWFKSIGHGGILYNFKDVDLTRDNLIEASNYEVFHSMPSPDNGPVVMDYTDIYENDDENASHWTGCYEPPVVANEGLSNVARLKVLKNCKLLKGMARSISYMTGTLPTDAVRTTSGYDASWLGNYGDIAQLRCGGLIEIIYEYPLNYIYNVWGRTGYPIKDYMLEHNDQDLAPGDWYDTFTPATQSGHVTLSDDTGTTFENYQYVAEPGLLD